METDCEVYFILFLHLLLLVMKILFLSISSSSDELQKLIDDLKAKDLGYVKKEKTEKEKKEEAKKEGEKVSNHLFSANDGG